MIQVVAPDGTLTIVTYWDAQGVMTVQGLMDNTDVIDPDAGSVMMASPSSRGTATFTIQGASLTLGRHILELEASLSGTPTTLTVFVYSAEPPTDLVVHDLVDGQAVYRFGDMQIYLTASLTAGSDLEVEWFIGDDLFVYQQYDQADTSVTIAQQWPFDTLLPVTLIVFNQQTTIATQFELHIVWALNTLGVSPTSEISALPGDLITLTLTFYDGVRTPMAPILMTVTWDTDTAVNYTLGPISGGYFIDFSHTYTTQGDRSISVVLRTPVDSVGYTRPARIWEEVNVELLTSTSFTVTRDVITLTFVSNSSHGFQYEIDYGEGTLTNNRSAMFEAYAAPSPPLTISYTSNGIYTVHLRAFNDKYSCESSKTITVQTVITADDMVLSPNPAVVAFPDGDVQLTLDVTSSSVEGDVDCSWDFGDASGTTLPAQKLYLPTDFPVETPFQYSGPGNFTVTLLCANNVSSFNLTSEVIVKDWEITDFDLVLDSTQAMNGMVVTEITPFNLTLMDIMNPPSGLTATFTYGDGSPPETLNVNSWEFNHMYPTRGVYSGSLLLEHAVKGSTTLDFIMRLGIFQPSVGSLGGLVETHIFDFVVNVPDGFSGTATVDFGDGNSATVPDITAGNDLIYRHSYAAVGFYNAHMTGTWLTETEAVDFEDTIEVDGSVSDLLITLSPENILFPPGETEATVLLNRAVHRLMFAECHVDFNEELDPAPRNWSGPMEPGDSFTIPFAYLTLGSKAVSLNCSNKFSEFSTVVYALAYNPCFSDDPIFDRQYGQWHSPIEDGVFLRDREDLVQPEVDYLMKRRGELEPGLYKLTLNISFGPEHDNIWLQESTFVQIVRAPLVAEISGGNIRDAGTDLDLIDARSLSYDPVTGIDDKEGLQFIWKCKQFATNSLAELLPFTSQRNYSDMGTCDDISTEELPGQRRLSLDSSVAAVGILFQMVCLTCGEADMLDSQYEWALSILNDNDTFEDVPNVHAIMLESGDMMTQRFTLRCSGWIDEGFIDPTNNASTTTPPPVSLYYKYMLRKNGIIVPIAEGGESNMPRTQLPLIPGQIGSDYEMVARIYDPLQDYTEVVQPVNLFVVHNSSTEFSEVLNFWGGQAYYTDHSSTITKQLRGLTTASALLSTYNGSHVVSQNWTKLWHDLNNPVTSMEKTNLTKMTEAFTKMVERRDEESANLTGLGITALGEGMATILFNSAITDTEAVIASADIADKGTEAMRKIFSTRPYPIGAKLSEAVFSMTGLVDRVLDSSLPTYDLSLGTDVIFNSSDIGEDDRAFLLERIKKSAAVKENRRIETTKTVMPKLEKTLDTMFDSLLTTAVLGQPTVTVDRGNIGLAAAKLTGRSLAAKHFIARNFDLSLDTVDEDGEESDEDATVEVKATVFERNPFAWSSDGSSYDITSPVVKLDLKDKNGHRKLRNITMRIKRNAAARTRTKRSAQTPGGIPNMETYSTNDTRAGDDQLIYHRLSVQSTSSAVVTYFKPPAHLTTVVAYYRQGRPPTLDRHDARVEGERDVSRKRRAAPDVTTGATDTDVSSTDGEPYKFYVPAGSLRPGEAFVGIYLPELGNETVEYEYMTFTDSCRVWNEEEEIWDSSSCTVSAFSTAEETVCICGDPPSMTFGSGFFVAPTTIDFDLVFLKFDPTNASVYGTLIGLFLVWILALLWARRKDRQDKNRWLVGYLKDNLVDDSYFYLLTVHTGLRRGAGTRSNVKFIITGERGDSGVRALSDGKRYLETGSVMTYIMATTESLGDLRYVRVWHDDSGPGEEASWFLGKFIVEDLQSAERFMFVCDRWLAIDKEDGLVDRILPIAGKDDVMTFDKLFSEHARVGVTDSHLWLSCFLRPDRSTFTRLQRVSCCMGLLLLTMITSAMFYQPEDSETGESPNKMGTEIEIGIMRFSMTTLWTSTVSIVITTIPTLLFVLLFRSKTITDKKKRDEMDKNTSDLLDTVLMENPLPHFVTYITWVLLLLTMVACSFFLLLYSMQWGKATSEEWIGSFFLSFMESIFVLDPIKVMLVACLLAFCARNPHAATKHQFVDMKRVQVEAETFGAEEMDPTAVPPDPVPKSVLEAARERRHQEQLAQQVFFELLLYSFFVLCIFSVSYGNRDYRTYMTNTHLENILYSASGTAPVPFETIGKREDVMEWLDKTLLTTLFPWTNLIGQELDWKRRLFASDFVSFRVGPVRVRQLRMPSLGYPKVTRMYPELKDDKVPFPPYNMVDEDKESYCLGWKPRPCSDTELSSKLSGPAWSHTPMKNVTDMPVWGTFALYSAGGYAVDFAVNRDIVANTIQELTENQWLDLQTRAVFVEFCLYNANINLFTFVRLAAEFPEVGSAVVWRDIKTLRIYNHLGPLGAYMFICELISVIVVIVFTVKVVISLKKMKCKFFRDFWKVLDLGVVLFAYVALAFYIVKTLAVDETMELWRLDPKVYIDFYLTVLWDDIYGFILAGLVFVVTIRLLRVLGYNKRITMIGTVLAKSGVDLLGFSVVFMVIIMAYVSAGVTFFAGSMYEFRTVWDSFFTLYLVLLGKNVLGRFIQEASLFAQAYFISLTVLVILILYTMFQAILCNTTVLVRSDILKVPPPYGLADILHKFYRAALADWIPSWLVRSNQAAVKPTEPVAEATRPGGFSAANLPPVHQDDNRTQPHRVLAAIFDHFNKTFDTKMRERKKPKREKKAWEGFSSLKTQSCESLV
nr:hypothetical protein BaRGS_024512 [Batillaria attramentaria]